MKNINLLVAILLSIQVSHAQTENVSPFDGIEISGSITAEIIKSNEEKVEYEIVKGDKDNLIIKTKDNALIVKVKNGWNYKKGTSAKVKIYYKEIDDLEISSGSTVKVMELIESRRFDLEVSSGSTAKVNLSTDSGDVEVSSGSSLELIGNASTIDLEVSSGSTCRAKGFEVNNADVEVSSGSTATLTVLKVLDLDVSSGSTFRYKGNPSVDSDKDISSTVSKM